MEGNKAASGKPGTKNKEGLKKSAPIERTIDLFLNGAPFVSLQASPHEPQELALGFLLNENLVQEKSQIKSIAVKGLAVEMEIDSPIDLTKLRGRLTSGCGRGITFTGKLDLELPVSDLEISVAELHKHMVTLAVSTPLYSQTGGMHAAGIASIGEVLNVQEDLGRHNAVDRLRAWMFHQTELPRELLLLTSGRISTEMVVKAARMGASLIASRTAATDRAVALAQEAGIEIVGYMRGNRHVLYTSVGRLIS